MAEIKGALLKAWLNFLNERYGAQCLSTALASLGAADRKSLAAPLLDSSWYSYDTLHALRRLSKRLVTRADGDLSIPIGRHMAQEVFTGVYHSLLVADPVKQVEKFAWISEFFFRETRTLETEVRAQSCLVRYTYDFGALPTRAICNSLVGFWSRTLELSGACNVKGEHPKCVLKQGRSCEFTFRWE